MRARSYARDVAVLADKVARDAVVDDMLVSLTAGQTHTFTIRTATPLDEPAALIDPRVLRCANALSAAALPAPSS